MLRLYCRNSLPKYLALAIASCVAVLMWMAPAPASPDMPDMPEEPETSSTSYSSSSDVITLLSPPNTTSPRATLEEFRSNMKLAHRLIMSAYVSGSTEIGLQYSPKLRQRGQQAEEALERAIKTLDLSEVPPAQLGSVIK